MKWVRVGKAHWNTDLIQAFSWTAGTLVVYWVGDLESNPDTYKDPDRAMYNSICRALGVAPVEVASDGES